MAHNTQLRNIISKSERKRDVKQSAKSQKAFDFSKYVKYVDNEIKNIL